MADLNHYSIDLKNIVGQVLELAKHNGATSAEADIGAGQGLSVTARMGDVETVEHHRDKGLSVTVFIGQSKGSASTTDFSDSALENTVKAACTIAKSGGEDDCAGLIDSSYLAKDIPELDLFHPWDITPAEAIEMAIQCESTALKLDKRLKNSDGTSINAYTGTHIYGNSHGFCSGWDSSSHSIDCTVIAESNNTMQRDGWYSRSRDANDLEGIESIAEKAANRAISRIDSRKLSTRSAPVIFEAQVASGLFGSFLGAISGGALYRKSSFLLDKLDTQIFADQINIKENPLLKKAMGSAPFDNNGMATMQKELVNKGILKTYLLSAYSARKLGMKPTGNAGGIHNLIVEPGSQDLASLIKTMGTGLLIREMIGFGVNQVTGDYSRGASGFWVENGEIKYPVEEITVAGNLLDMFKNIISIGNDVDTRGNIQTGSVLIDPMTIAGE